MGMKMKCMQGRLYAVQLTGHTYVVCILHCVNTNCQTKSQSLMWKHKWIDPPNHPKPPQGLPYIPRVHLSEGSLVRSPLKLLCSEEPMVRRSFIPKFLYSESCYVPKIPYSERPFTIWILCYEDSLVRSSSSPNGAMFRKFRPSDYRTSDYRNVGLKDLRNRD